MFLFIAFAAIVWAGLYVNRRTWWALVWYVSAIVALVTVGLMHTLLNIYYNGTIYLGVTRAILIPYGVFVCAFGAILALMPRPVEGRPCSRCKYDVSGLAEEGRFCCPECNTQHAFAFEEAEPCRVCGAKLSGITPRPDIECWRCRTLYLVNPQERGLRPPVVE